MTTLIPPTQLRLLGSQAQVNAIVDSVPSYPYNLAKAKAEMAASPYPHGFSGSTWTIQFGSYTPVNEVIAAELKEIGINLKLDLVGFDQYESLVSGTKNYGGLYGTFNLADPDPSSFPAFILGSSNIPKGGYNWANYDPPVIDTLINEGVTTQSPAQRLAVYGEMLRILAADEPYVRYTSRITTSLFPLG